MSLARLVIVVIWASAPSTHARADEPRVNDPMPAQVAPAEERRTCEPSAESDPVGAAPTFRGASGLELPRDADEGAGLKAARIALLPVRAAWFVVLAPVRATAWAYDRFALESRFRRMFFSEDGKVGAFPIVLYRTGFGPQVGARAILRDLLGDGSKLQIAANYGGEVLQSYKLHYRGARLFDNRIELDLRTGFEAFPRSRFFGIGNGDETSSTPSALIDPLRDATARDTRFYYDAFAAEGGLSLHLPGPFRASVGGGYRLRDFDRNRVENGDLATAALYDTTRLVGFDTGLSTVWGGLRVVLDTVRQPRYYLSRALPSRGWYVAARAAYFAGLGDDPSSYVRLGLDAQRRINLYADDRILVLRATYDGVVGAFEHVPFVDLPTLGGSQLLRGYPVDRFRDRHAATGSLEYQWGVDRNVAAFLFTDVGRVWRDDEALARGDLRVSYGGGLQIHSRRNFFARVMVASTIDGGLFLSLGLDPLFDAGRTE